MRQGFQTEQFKVSTEDGRNFTLLEAVRYLSNDGTLFEIPFGATSDGASTPSGLWPMIPPFGPYWKAAFLHDSAYRNTLRKVTTLNAGVEILTLAELSKESCDELLKEAMKSLQVHEALIIEIYEGVRFAGWSSFEEDRKQFNS
ncbi:MAG: DUF1353 domain-containing protein [Nitrososphaeria archaeon]|jgi:hypothetical protein